jgi:Ca-activated chloride channel family protein
MKKFVLFVFLFVLFTSINYAEELKKIDDWDDNVTIIKEEYISYKTTHSMGGNIASASMVARRPVSMMMKSRKLGMAVGGAKDTDNFKENISYGYIPKINSLTYEGTFYQHYFDTGSMQECTSLFCPSYSRAIKRDIYTDEKYYYLNVGLNSDINESDFKRKKLNLVVVLDISGSMGSRFNQYYYKGKKHSVLEGDDKSKMQIANETIVAMMEHLEEYDSLGVVLFDNRAYPVKLLREVKYTDMKAIKKHVLDLHQRGGTNWSAGYKSGLKYFDAIEQKKGYENRIIFITDAMPNAGELGKDKLFDMAKSASKRGIHTTFVGVGVDFNANLVEYVSKTKGANYYSVHSSKEFKKRMDIEFDFMVTPLVYDLELDLESKGYKINAVYGSPDANLATGTIMKINTLFPSLSSEDKVKGGIVLLRLRKTGDAEDIKLNVSYKDVNGKEYNNIQKISFNRSDSFYDNNGIRKGILLSEYVTLMKNWMIDVRAGCNDKVKYMHQPLLKIMRRCMIYPPMRDIYSQIKTWERKSCKLHVSAGYKKILSLFKRHYQSEMRVLEDKSLNTELNILNRLVKPKVLDKSTDQIDDWHQ